MIWMKPSWSFRQGIGWIQGRSLIRQSNFWPEGWMAPWSSCRISSASLCPQTRDVSLSIRPRPLCLTCFLAFSGTDFIRDFSSSCSCGWECSDCWTWSCQTARPCFLNRMEAIQQSSHRWVIPDTTSPQVFHGLAYTKFLEPDTPAYHKRRRRYSR